MRPTNKYEQRRHGRADFPLQHYHVNRDDPRYVMVAHWHREMEFIHFCGFATEIASSTW